jgi:hypothetical protein
MMNDYPHPNLPASRETAANAVSRKTISAKDLEIPGRPPSPASMMPGPFTSNMEGALWWFAFGYRVIPLVPGQKRPARAFNPWLAELSADTIRQHWKHHPDHEVGAVLDGSQFVLDADSEEAGKALLDIERQFGVTPSLVIKTRRGHHHHFRLSQGTFAKADSHHTEEFPDRLDLRANNNSIVLTPSRDKAIHLLRAGHRDQLAAIDQNFVDAVFRHNGRPADRKSVV